MNLFLNQEHTHKFKTQTYGYQKGNMSRRDKLEVWD